MLEQMDRNDVGEQSEARRFFRNKLRFETDPADVHLAREQGRDNFILLDVRSAEDYAEKHVARALSLPWREISAERMAAFPDGARFVVYCWGPGCNGSTKAALRLARLGFAVREMIGGIEYWEREGYTLDGLGVSAKPNC